MALHGWSHSASIDGSKPARIRSPQPGLAVGGRDGSDADYRALNVDDGTRSQCGRQRALDRCAAPVLGLCG